MKDLKNIVENLQKKFGDNLISVIIFGSYARECADNSSDIDLIIVARDLPKDFRERDKITLSILMEHTTLRLQIFLFDEEDIIFMVDNVFPFMLEIYDANKILQDRDDFFKMELERFDKILKERGVKKIKDQVWEVPDAPK